MLTVVIVVYKDDENLKKCLKSVPFEIKRSEIHFLVKDAEVRNAPKFIKEYSVNYRNFQYISNKDYGIYDGMNQALEYVNTTFVLFLGADDELIITNKAYKRIVNKYFKNDSVSMVYGDVLLRKDGRVYDGKFSKYKILKRNICHQAIMYRTECLERYKFNTEYRSLADYAINIKFFAINTAIYCGEIISIYENRSGYSTQVID